MIKAGRPDSFCSEGEGRQNSPRREEKNEPWFKTKAHLLLVKTAVD